MLFFWESFRRSMDKTRCLGQGGGPFTANSYPPLGLPVVRHFYQVPQSGSAGRAPVLPVHPLQEQ